MRTPAEVDELGAVGPRVAVHGDGGAGADLGGVGGIDLLDDLDLVGLVGELAHRVVAGELFAHEGLVGGDDLAHARLDALEVVVGEVLAVRQLEVVVEAVLDRGADRVLRAGKEIGDGLGHHVRGRVAQHFPALVAGGRDDSDARIGFDRAVEIGPVAVDLRGQRGLGEPLADRAGDLAAVTPRS